jgi:hypothetical protein
MPQPLEQLFWGAIEVFCNLRGRDGVMKASTDIAKQVLIGFWQPTSPVTPFCVDIQEKRVGGSTIRICSTSLRGKE